MHITAIFKWEQVSNEFGCAYGFTAVMFVACHLWCFSLRYAVVHICSFRAIEEWSFVFVCSFVFKIAPENFLTCVFAISPTQGDLYTR